MGQYGLHWKRYCNLLILRARVNKKIGKKNLPCDKKVWTQKCANQFFSRELLIGQFQVVTHFCVYDSLSHGTTVNFLFFPLVMNLGSLQYFHYLIVLIQVGKSVAVDARDASTIMVQHRHGNEAGDVTYNAMNIGVNMTKTFFHIEDFGLKKVCKNIAKSTGKEYLQQHLDRRNGKQLRTGVDTGTSQVPPQRPPQPIY